MGHDDPDPDRSRLQATDGMNEDAVRKGAGHVKSTSRGRRTLRVTAARKTHETHRRHHVGRSLLECGPVL